MAPEKSEAVLVTDRRSFQYPSIALGEHEIEWKKSIKYLVVQLDRRLSFGEHLQIATLSWNQPFVKFKAERRFRGRCIGSREGVFWF